MEHLIRKEIYPKTFEVVKILAESGGKKFKNRLIAAEFVSEILNRNPEEKFLDLFLNDRISSLFNQFLFRKVDDFKEKFLDLVLFEFNDIFDELIDEAKEVIEMENNEMSKAFFSEILSIV